MENKERTYTLIVKKCRIPVSEEVYKEYYKLKEREKYLDKLSQEKHISLEASTDSGIQIEYVLASHQQSLEDSIINKEILTNMLGCIALLDDKEKQLIDALYFKGKSEHQIAMQLGITQQAVNKRKTKILSKLKKMMEI